MIEFAWVSDDSEPEDQLGGMVRRRDRGKMPVASESRARAACKATWRSKVVSRRLGRRTDGIRNRRQRKVD